MKILKSLILTAPFILSSCSNFQATRSPASQTKPKVTLKCFREMHMFMEDGYSDKLRKAAEDKELVHRSTDSLIVNKPKESIRKVIYDKTYRFFRFVNDNEFPTYYIFDEEETLSSVIVYVKALAGDPKAQQKLEELNIKIGKWLSDYQAYNDQVKELLETRVSIKYNLELLKLYKKKAKDFDRVELQFKKNGKWEPTVFTFRKEDENLKNLIEHLEHDLKYFDGGIFAPKKQNEFDRINFNFLTDGVIKNRISHQAKLKDKLVILHRELEFAYLNIGKRAEFTHTTAEQKAEIQALYQKITKILKDESIQPSSYARRNISYSKAKEELKRSVKNNKVYKNFTEKSELIKEYLESKDLSRGKILSQGYAAQARMAYIMISGGIPLGGTIYWFDLDEKLGEYYQDALRWWYGDKILCTTEKTDDAYTKCLWVNYQEEFPDLVNFAIKNPSFNPWDMEQIRQVPLPKAILDAYISDFQQMEKFRAYSTYIRDRQKEILKLYKQSVSGKPVDIDGIKECIIINPKYLPLCIYEKVYTPVASKLDDKREFELLKDDFDYQNPDLPEELRKEYDEKVQQIMYERKIIEDISKLPSYAVDIFFDQK
ncbi:hypothetical protein HBN50_02320 [Halobacteriovorax sp. GB3]|uniref:hypothetical protein n=1 Tax=Halobacteriovorax sp. GB3 TaxID=2719615 RepID=UPI00235E353D|nr:hypothetical protein [Halobacteriovorax sp. GB3]MDD0851908.1 hypothetical protein [Halobacteriovorax sp. GB3]